jgi:glucarate dehydratase
MKIADIRATTVAVPLEAPLRHSNGAHWGRIVRTLVEVETDEGLVGLGEMGGGGESAEAGIRSLRSYLVNHDPVQLEQKYWKICNPTASLYNSRGQIHAALEFACIDLIGKKLGLRACDLLGGSLRERVPFASYLFYRYPDPKTGLGVELDREKVRQYAEFYRRTGPYPYDRDPGRPDWYAITPSGTSRSLKGKAGDLDDHVCRR